MRLCIGRLHGRKFIHGALAFGLGALIAIGGVSRAQNAPEAGLRLTAPMD